MDEDRITIIAESFEAAALEFHRRNLSAEGYRMAGPITMSRFEMLKGPERSDLFDGKPMFAVTFVKEA